MSPRTSQRSNLRLLVVEDGDDLRQGLRLLFATPHMEIREAASGEEALAILRGWNPHAVLCDLVPGEVSGMEVLERIRRLHPSARVLVLTGFGTIERAVEAIQKGTTDVLTKPFDPEEIRAAVELHGREARRDSEMSEAQVLVAWAADGVVARDPKMTAVLDLAEQVGPTSMTVLISGESGTGKELVARAIHRRSPDPSRPFLAVNSAALPDTLLESELFGHVKGAFTGADSSREGIFAQARGGTVFLDEIALMSLPFQGKLLRVLQEHTVTPLGSAKPRPVSFRLVAATNRSLRERIAAGHFREDLYYRLRVVMINVPPLRERPGDVEPLALHFLRRYAEQAGLSPERPPSFTAEALDALKAHAWPGNVRELENTVQRALLLCRGKPIRSHHLNLDEQSHPWRQEPAASLSYEEGKRRAVSAYQRRVVERALTASRGNVSQAAASCGLTRAAFQRIMRQLGIERERFFGNG